MERLTKTPHAYVGFEHPSQHGGEQCRNCIHFIVDDDARKIGPRKPHLRCETVMDPIDSTDWCQRFEDRG